MIKYYYQRQGGRDLKNNFDEQIDFDQDNLDNDQDYAYKNVMGGNRNSRLYSVISLVLAVLSVGFCFIPPLGIILGLVAIGFGVFSRRSIGYFDGLSLGGIITSIFGVVFSISAILLDMIF